MDDNKNRQGTARSTSWATPSAYEKQNNGEQGQTAGRSSRHYEGHFHILNIKTLPILSNI